MMQDAGQVTGQRSGRGDSGGAGGDREVVVVRDAFGAPFAIEVVDAAAWREEFTEPPAPEQADVRIVRLRRGRVPAVLPAWLHVEVRSARVAEAAAGYAVAGEVAAAASADDLAVAERLWRASTGYREPGPPLAEFMAAGAVAVRYPQPVPTGTVRQRAVVEAFVRGRGGALGVTATLDGDARERWLRYTFGVPDRFADALLLARLDDTGATEVVSALRFLREAEVEAGDAKGGPLAELMFDRRALLEQASPWRYLEQFEGAAGASAFAGALSAVRAWRLRYRVAYAAHYTAVLREASEVRRELDTASGAAEALRRLDAMRALGAPVGGAALMVFATTRDGLAALLLEPDAEAPRTADVTLGAPLELVARARTAIEAVRAALEQQRARLASRAAHLVLAREEVPALDRLLQAITASDLGGIERVLDARLAAHIQALLAEPVAAR
jgi:hypothetical protein